mmetsp:Transcript_22931/g.52566  ORF Transcript_22931/g.52566 Transcript_22931/m.52566 type:complete len:221 (-) Transcript_22931:221-883(-)
MFSCKACKPADPATATVKIDPASLAEDKENVAQNSQHQQEAALERKQREEQQDPEQEERKAAEAHKAEEERRRLEQERLEAAQREADELEKCREREAERQRLAAEERLQREEMEHREQEKQREEQAKADAEALSNFLTTKGYKEDVNGKRKTMMKHYHPLHDAVQMKDADLVRILLEARADPTLRSSSGKTALERAKKSNSDGTLSTIVEELSSAMPEEN